MKKRIYYNHTDAEGIVYHPNFLTFCEQARSEIFFSNGVFFEKNEGYVIKSVKAEYYKSLELADIIEIKTKVKKIKKSSVTYIQKIYRNDELVFELIVTDVYLKNKKIAKIPKKHLEILNEYVQ